MIGGISMENDYPVLYVFVRSDMHSLGSSSGKMAAHSGHAANAFIYDNVVRRLANKVDIIDIPVIVSQWMYSTSQGFGTQINLKAPWAEVLTTLDKARANNFVADLVIDPTYPYVVNSEIVTLIDNKLHTQPPVDLENGSFLCFRSEVTAAYIFGLKSHLEPLVGCFELHP
jgi:hypothetical protein